MRAHPPSLVIAAALCWLIASPGTAPPASAQEEAPAEAELEEAAPSGDEGAQEGGEDLQAPAEAEPEEIADTEPVQDERIEQLYVTATKREESLQEVPISMAALDAGFIEDSGTTQFGQLQQYVPNLRINPVTDTRGTIIRIRGIGSVGNNSGIDPSVGVFIDNVYQGRAGMSVGDLLDVERVEVLRGPQGTLYGKNTAAGLIHVISKRPSYEPEATLEGVFGSYTNYEGRASVNIPLVDDHIATRLSGYLVRRDGFDLNTWLDKDINDDNRWGIKSRTVFDITDSFSILLSGDYSYQDNQCCVADLSTIDGAPTLQDGFANPDWNGSIPDPLTYPVDPSTYPGLSAATRGEIDPRYGRRSSFQFMEWMRRNEEDWGFPGATYLQDQTNPYYDPSFEIPEVDGFDREIHANVEPKNKVQIGGVSIDAIYDIGAFADIPLLDEASLNLIGAWRHYESNSRFDGDFSLFDVSVAQTDTELDQVSAELRLSSPGGELLDYQFGLYFYHQTQDTVDPMSYDTEAHRSWTLIRNSALNTGDNTHKTYSYAAFGQFTLSPIEWFSFTGGLRVTTEKKERVGSQLAVYNHYDNMRSGPPRFNEINWGVNVCAPEWHDGSNPGNPHEEHCLDAPPILGPPTYKSQSREVANVSWLANLRFFPTEDVMVYASAATGFKSGGFNQLRTTLVTPGEFDDERSLNLEAGAKTSWFEGLLTLNATGFWTEYKDFQAQVFTGAEINVINAATLESYGAEADLVLTPGEYLMIGSSLGFNIAEYGKFKNGLATAWHKWESTLDHVGGTFACGVTEPGGPFGDPLPGWDTGTGEWAEKCTQDLTGKTLDNAPKWTVSTWAQSQYLLPWWPLETTFGPGEVFLRAEYAFTSSRFLDVDLDPNLFQKPTHVLNLRGGIRAASGRWELTGWVKNLTDEEYNVVGFDAPTLNGFAVINAPPRQWGFTVRVNFGALVD